MEEAKKPAAKGILMTEGPIARQILAFTLPLLLGNVFQQLYNTVDSVVVGNFVGQEALATVGSSSSMIGMIVSLFMGIGVGASVIISQYYGAGNLKKMENAIYTAIAFGIAAGVLLTVIGIVVSPVILRWMKTPETVMEGSVIFLRIYFLGSLPSMLYNIGSSIFHAFGDSKKPLLYLIIASIVNILLDLLFVAVFRWGIAGAGYATVLSQTISAVLTYMTLTGKRSIYRLELKRIRFYREELRLIIRLGIPSGLQNSIISFSNVIVQSNINSFGDVAMAGCGAYGKIEGFALMPSGSFTMALSTFVSQNIGARKLERAKKGAGTGLLLSMGIVQLTGIMIYFCAPYLIRLFNSEPEVVSYGTLMARSVSMGYFMLAFSHGMGGVLRGAGLSRDSMVIMITFWCGLRVAWILTAVRFFGDIRIVFWAYPITWACSFVIFLWYFFRKDWLGHQIIE